MSLGDKTHCWSKARKKSSFVDQRRVFLQWHASAVMLFCLIFLCFWKVPNFCLDRPFRFSIHREYIPFLCPLFLPGLPFRVFSPPGRSLLPKLPFQVFNLASFLIFFVYFFVFLDYDCILLKAEVLSIVLSHVSLLERNRSRGGCRCTL